MSDGPSPGTHSNPDGSTVRIGAKALVVDDDRVLLVRERRDDGSTFWTLPGGGVERGESLTGGLARELREELDCEADIHGPTTTCVYSHRTMPGTVTAYVVFRTALHSAPTPNGTEGIVETAWFTPGELPPGTLSTFRSAVDEVFDRPLPRTRGR